MAARDSRRDLPTTGKTGADGGPIEAASFISETVAGLTQLARRHKLDMLGYLLEMARLESDEIVRRGKPEVF